MKAIAHPLRLKILCVLGNQEANVQDIVEAVGTSQSNISQHLAVLREKDIVGWRKEGNRVFYRVADGRTLNLIGMMREVFCGDLADGDAAQGNAAGGKPADARSAGGKAGQA